MDQNEKTIKFINGVNALVNSGAVKNQTEIINALGWKKSMFSNVINGRRNIPNDKFKKFTEVYQIDDINIENYSIQKLNEIGAMCNVLISTVGELLAIQRGKPVGSIIENLQKAVNEKITGK